MTSSKSASENAYPSPDLALPSDDGGIDPGMGLDHGTFEYRRPFDAHPVFDHDVGPYGHVRAYPAVFADLGGLVLCRRDDSTYVKMHISMTFQTEQ